jgi:acetyltransferase-like isoleucine patch superfamily enzyme
MIKKIIVNIFRHFAMKYGKFNRAYLKIANLTSYEYADYLRETNFLYRQGINNSFNKGTNFTDPQLVSVGSNCIFSDCTLLGHDASSGVLNSIFNDKFDSVGKIEVGDNVFIGHGAIIMPNISIASNTIVAAGAVVTKNVNAREIVAGVPARPISTVDELAQKTKVRMQAYPWLPLILKREGAYDPVMEDELTRLRQLHFFKNK